MGLSVNNQPPGVLLIKRRIHLGVFHYNKKKRERKEKKNSPLHEEADFSIKSSLNFFDSSSSPLAVEVPWIIELYPLPLGGCNFFIKDEPGGLRGKLLYIIWAVIRLILIPIRRPV